MHYQVGNKCLDKAQAENIYFSLVVPQITSDGQIIKPEYNGIAWQLNGQIIQANLPECNPADNVKNGLEIGWLVFGVMASCYFVIVIKRLLK
jgi:hypothetical protein